MKTVRITADFDSYPNGKDRRTFTKGEEPELSNEHADLLIAKGLAEDLAPAARQPASKKKDTDA
ncbi:hypothetical protein J2X36_000846 [Methylobacterium sp. BE186]|uniref:hypothetical protein n=1 Tax=Methylobacterium sp. BE186 TaxID=2817715 RepID=UPI002858D8A6|nr:hypothetical protein [Methylobacterium sp. BE186]MDR7036110.1 hypothetical protein [Methylobacterium sp. BE186]